MLTFQSHEVKIIKGWSEKAQGSPFPQEINLLNKLSRIPAFYSLTLTKYEVEVVQYWAEQDTTGHRGTEKYLLEPEFLLLQKIEKYLNE